MLISTGPCSKADCPIASFTLQRSKRSYGYFCGDRFGRTDGLVSDEIALNPRYFHVRPIEHVLSTLVHEMVISGSTIAASQAAAVITIASGPNR